MKKVLVTVAASLMAVAGAATFASPASAAPSADRVSPNIVGGTRAPATPWEVQLVFVQDGGTYGCTGEQINADWVLTANHCVDGISSMDVYQSNSTSNPGPAHAADEVGSAPTGDIGLVHLASSAPLSSYAPLNLGYGTQSSGSGTIMGYGLRANQQQPDGLYQATVNLTGSNTDAYGGTAQHVTGSNGASNHGDSGGPLLVGGRVVGVCSTGDTADPGSNIHAGSNYAILSQSANWISSTAGV